MKFKNKYANFIGIIMLLYIIVSLIIAKPDGEAVGNKFQGLVNVVHDPLGFLPVLVAVIIPIFIINLIIKRKKK